MSESTPRIISVDDHVVEPPTLWQEQLPPKYRDQGPRTVRKHGTVAYREGRAHLDEGRHEGAAWTDVWLFEDMAWPLHAGFALAEARDRDELDPVTYEDIAPGCWEQGARLEAMDRNHTEASLCFPTVPRFAGQLFLDVKDRALALACIQAYNDWMIDSWCAGEGYGRLIPQTLIPLWDPKVATEEVQRCADKGSHAITFTEAPQALGLPSMYSGHWDPLLSTCQETETVVNMHIGSSSRLPTTAEDAALIVGPTLMWQNTMHALVDWTFSGTLGRFPNLTVAFSEGQVGWMPFVLERMDTEWLHRKHDPDLLKQVPELPSSYVQGRVYGCIFDDSVGLKLRDSIGMEQICFEVDYPHVDSTFPESLETAQRLAKSADLTEEEFTAFIRGNAIRAYGLERLGLAAG